MTLMKNKKLQAFTLLELAIVLIIMSVTTSTMFFFLANSVKNTQRDTNQQKVDFVVNALNDFYIRTGYIPCPASLTEAPSTLNFGVSTVCNAGAVAGVNDIGSGADTVRRGMIPVRTMGLPDAAAYDAYGDRIQYTIIRDFGINASAFDSSLPTTAAITVFGYNPTGPTLTDLNVLISPNTLAYVVHSSGQDQNGAVTFKGTPLTCTSGGPNGYNCDNTYNQFVGSADISGTFDDIVVWKTRQQLKYDKVAFFSGTRNAQQTYGNIAIFSDTYGSGAASYGTGATNTTYYQRNLNTTQVNNLSNGSLINNSIVLGAGTYKISAIASSCGVNRNLLEIYSATSNSVLISGLAGYADSTVAPTDCRDAFLLGVITLTRTETIYLRHYVQTANITDGFGRSIASGYNQTYATLEIVEM